MKLSITMLILTFSLTGYSCSLDRLEEFTDSVEQEARAGRFLERFQEICQEVVDSEKCLIKKANGDYLEIGRIGAALMSCRAVLNEN